MNPTVKALSVGFIYPLGTLVLKPFGCGSRCVVTSEIFVKTSKEIRLTEIEFVETKL
jgi:hypothetical protein